ncbi:CXXC-type zinc finger protein 1, partial [Entomortierella lignicola]
MLDSGSGSSDLSDASSLSTDNSSGSEADVSKDKPQSTALRNKQQPLHHSSHSSTSSTHRSAQHDLHTSLPLLSSSGSDSEESNLEEDTAYKQKNIKDAPISLSASQPVYSQEIMDRSMMLLPSNSKYNAHSSHTPTSGRGRGRGRGRTLLSGHGSHKYDATGTTVIDFEDFSNALDESDEAQDLTSSKPTASTSIPNAPKASNTVRKKTETKVKSSKTSNGANGKQKSGSRKVGRPKSVSKDVYCICRESYDGVEFMIACDRCEEWFHGRCIGMKPQEAKKSSHYYCDTCQKIRRMFGVVTPSEGSSKPLKSKERIKKSTEKFTEKHSLHTGVSGSEELLLSSKIKSDLDSKNSQSYTTSIYSPSSPQTTVKSTLHLEKTQEQPYIQSKSTFSQDYRQSGMVPKTETILSQDIDPIATRRDIPLITSIKLLPLERVSQDEEEEDICPICDFECTCNTNKDASVEVVSPVVNAVSSKDESHALTAIKVPFQPNLGLQSASVAHNLETVDGDHHRSFLNAEKRPVIRAEDPDIIHDDAFRTSVKNPMSTPTSQRRLSVIRRGGKNIGKYPMKESLGQLKTHSRGKSFKAYQDPGIESGSEISNEFSEDEDQDGPDSGHDEFPHSPTLARPRARYESYGVDDGADDMDDSLPLSSSSSPSDVDEDSTRLLDRYQRTKGNSKILIGKKWSQPQASNSTGLSFDDSNLTGGFSEAVKKRGPGRPKKIRNPLIVSREDEMTLYTPAATARKLTATYPQKGESSKPTRVTVKAKVRTELPFIAYDPEVAEDVMALNALGIESETQDVGAKANATELKASGSRSEAFNEGDIFGDGDLSDELSGDLSDILSEDLEDFSGESVDFSSSEDEGEETTSSSPREFNYSEMEEQDESLVDSDSSINSITSDSSDSTESESASDEDEEIVVYEDIGSEGSIDEEELQILEEQERLILAKAHGLRDVFSEEDSDPDRNPFESSEDDDEEDEDERVFDGDDDDMYSDEYYEDDYLDDEYDEMDEQAILAQLKGVQSDIQALMMIPPEQQEQLLLLQHYEEAHRQQQQDGHLSHDQFQISQDQGSQSQELDPQQGAHVVSLMETSGFLPQFDMNVPDLDAVSEQLAASLADSIAKSMAGAKQALEEGSSFQQGALDVDISTQPVDSISTENSVGAPLNVSPRSSISLSPGPSDVPWSAPIPPSSPNSEDSSSGSIPTPVNTPTPRGTIFGASPSLPVSSENDPHKHSLIVQQVLGSSSEFVPKQQAVQGKIETLSHSSTYKPLSSITVSTIGGRQIQPILPKLSSGESLTGLDSVARIQSADLEMFKDATQRVPIGSDGQDSSLGKSVILESDLGGAVAFEDGLNSGDTTDDASPTMHIAETKKRKGENIGLKEVKRKQLSIGSSKGGSKDGMVLSVPTPESEESLPSSSLNSPPISSLSVESMPSFDVTTSSSCMDSPSSFSATSTAELTPPIAYDFTKATMPFVDPSTRILSSTTVTQGRDSSSQSLRLSKTSLKGKELKQQADVMPMDDLLDTSALYGRSSSRSPSPNRPEAEEEDDSEISQSMLKDLNRWERVPIGTFRRSRRPSSPYVGLQGALKFGNTAMPATLLADHQQHQQQLYQESHRLQKRPPGARKHRNPSSLVSDSAKQGSRPEDLGQIRHGDKQEVMLRRRRRAGSNSSHLLRLGGIGGLYIPSSNRRISKSMSSGFNSDLHTGLGVDLGSLLASGITMSSSSSSKTRTMASNGIGKDVNKPTAAGIEELKDLMTDSSQLPSSACPTPLHSPLFSATAAGGRVMHHSSGEPVVVSDGQSIDKSDDIGSRGEDSIISHLELDIGKEMDGFHERLLVKTKAE